MKNRKNVVRFDKSSDAESAPKISEENPDTKSALKADGENPDTENVPETDEKIEKAVNTDIKKDENQQTDVERTISDIKQEKLSTEERGKEKHRQFMLALKIIFFPITGIVYLFKYIFRKLNLPLTAKLTIIYTFIFVLVLTGFTVFFVESLKKADDIKTYLSMLVMTASVLVVVASVLYAAMVWLSSQFMLKPIRTITEKIDEITDDNLSARVEQTDSQDELMELTNRINEMLDNLEQSFIRQQNFVADASHELKTPIAVIQGYSNMLKRWGKDDPKVLEEGIEAISRESEHMKKLVEQLLLLAKLGNFTMNETEFNLVEVVSDLASSYKMVDFTHNIIFKRAEDNITVKTDKYLLTECVRAIVDNAIKYTPGGGRITVSCELCDDHAEISVADTGIGIKPEDLPHVFERFYRCDKARGRESGSNGLGLSIAKSIVENMGGEISVTSDVGLGTKFVVKLF